MRQCRRMLLQMRPKSRLRGGRLGDQEFADGFAMKGSYMSTHQSNLVPLTDGFASLCINLRETPRTNIRRCLWGGAGVQSAKGRPGANDTRFTSWSIWNMKTTVTTCAAMLLASVGVAGSSFADTFGMAANQFDIEFVTIGNPGNPPDDTGNPNRAGGVDYIYNMGKYEISRDAIEKANAEGNLGLTLDPMDFVTGLGDGPRPAMPATGISWNEAARFVNWLNTSNGFTPAYKFSTQPEDIGYDANANVELWQPTDAGYDAHNLFRNSQAHYFLPSVDEWYKAAFYDPNANGGSGGYWNYPTVSDRVPRRIAGGTGDFTAVWNQQFAQGPADITDAGGLSPYGTMAQGGNVYEWEETTYDLANDVGSSVHGVRGGYWSSGLFGSLSASVRYGSDIPPNESVDIVGFRVASVTEEIAGDLNRDGLIDSSDIDLISSAIRHGLTDSRYDLTEDGQVNMDDRTHWVHELANTYFGDANLDGEFNSSDMTFVFQAGEYEDNITLNSSWPEGDWNGDGDFDSTDFIVAFQDGGYEQGPRTGVQAVPEPTSVLFLLLSLPFAIARTRRSQRRLEHTKP